MATATGANRSDAATIDNAMVNLRNMINSYGRARPDDLAVRLWAIPQWTDSERVPGLFPTNEVFS